MLVAVAPLPALLLPGAVPPAIWVVVAVQLAASAMPLLRWSAPLAATGVVCAVAVLGYLPLLPPARLDTFVTLNLWPPFAVSGAVATWYVRRHRRGAWPVLAPLAVATALAAHPWRFDLAGSSVGLLHTLVPALLGLYLAARAEAVRALRERAVQAEREQELRAERARAAERARLAAELHDAVSHRVNLMVLQAGALRLTATDDATVRAAETLRETGCRALAELAELLGLLRTGETPATPDRPDGAPPLPDALRELVAGSRAVGLPVELAVTGAPTPVPPAARRTAYRVVQEALTNVHKHAPGAPVTVDLGYRPDGLALAVRNGPAAGPPATPPTGTGSGLVGLRRRVEILGGTLSAVPTDGGGFALDAIIPAHVPDDA